MQHPRIDIQIDTDPKPLATHPLYQSLRGAASSLPEPVHCYTMAKPTGSVCNLDCHYCFYLEKEKLYPERQKAWRMGDETLQRYIEQQIDAQAGGQVVFSWQGGEPTMMGVAFYQKAFEMQKAYAEKLEHQTGRLVSVVNTFQTNGILLDEAWMALFKTYSVLVGISIDGPQELHDIYRVKRNGAPTFDRVMAAVHLLKHHDIPFNTLTVVHRENARHPREVYEFLTGIGSGFLQFIPLVEREAQDDSKALKLVLPDETDASVTPWSLLPNQFGTFLSDIFDLWVTQDVGKVFVQMFDSTLASHLGYPATLCSHAAQCGSNFALEANGDVYACDHYVYPEHYLATFITVRWWRSTRVWKTGRLVSPKWRTLAKVASNARSDLPVMGLSKTPFCF